MHPRSLNVLTCSTEVPSSEMPSSIKPARLSESIAVSGR